MKIKEITESNYKVTQSDPEKVEISSADGATKITTTPAAIQPKPNTPNISTLNLNPANAPQGQQGNETMGQPVPGQQPAPAQQGQVPQDGQPQQGQIPVANGQQPAPGQQQPGQPAPQQQQQAQLPKVGSEIELPDNIGSTMQEMLDDKDDADLIASHENKDISGDPTDDFINDVVDKKFEKNSGRNHRNVVHPTPIKESEELIAMLTIAGLR
jgi:hypothetical protein